MVSKIPRVLIVTPTHKLKDYCKQEFRDRVMNLNYPRYDILIIDNTNYPELKIEHISVRRDISNFLEDISNPNEVVYYKEVDNGLVNNSRTRITSSYNVGRDFFLQYDYDYMLTLESDMIPNKYIIELLLAHNKDVVAATYMIGYKNDRRCCIFTGKMFKREIRVGVWKKMMENINLNEINGQLIKAPGGCGLGCTLIKREVVEKISFRDDEAHCDTYFHRDVHKLGYESYADTGIIVEHLNTSEKWLGVDF